MRTLILGGARSGKSSLALRWARDQAASAGLEVCCLVTARAADAEMTVRIAAHRAERPATWRTVEVPVRLGEALRAQARRDRLLLVDCLTLWSANCLWPQDTLPDALRQTGDPLADLAGWRREREAFLDALRDSDGPVLLVSNEVGLGIVPADPGTRLFRDEHGWLNQAVAAACEQVFLVSAGLPLRLK